MDKPQALSRQIGLTRGKAILIATLSIVLAVVLYLQYGPSGEGDVAPQPAAYRTPAASATSRTVAATGRTSAITNAVVKTGAQAAMAIDHTQWKAPDLSSVIAFDPFAVPESFPKSLQVAVAGDESGAGSGDAAVAAELLTNAIEELRLELQELQQRGVHVILKQHDQYVAMIGDRTVRVGDEINGFTVTAIEPDHVRVEWKVKQ